MINKVGQSPLKKDPKLRLAYGIVGGICNVQPCFSRDIFTRLEKSLRSNVELKSMNPTRRTASLRRMGECKRLGVI